MITNTCLMIGFKSQHHSREHKCTT